MPEGEGLHDFERACSDARRDFESASHAAVAQLERRPGGEGIYLSPLWEAETSSPERSRAWKVSVLRRVPGAGAEPWGHLFFVVLREGGGQVQLRTEIVGILGPAVPSPPEGGVVPLAAGPPARLLLLRPRDGSTEPRLRGFAEAVRDAFPGDR